MKIRLLENTDVDMSIYRVDDEVEVQVSIGAISIRCQLSSGDAAKLAVALRNAALDIDQN